jgi:hypothetical protein
VSGTPGATGTESTTADTGTATDPLQALGSLMHNLFAAIQSQGGQVPSATNTGPGGANGGGQEGGSASAAQGVSGGHHHRGGGIAQMESKLQSLIRELSASSNGPTTMTSADNSGSTASTQSAGAANGSTSAWSSESAGSSTNTSNDALSALQQSYQTLLASLGANGNNSTLGNFLQALSRNLQGIGPSGNVVRTQA